MPFSLLGFYAFGTPSEALSVPFKSQSRAVSYSMQITVQLTVAREPRPKALDELNATKSKEEATRSAPQAPLTPLTSRSFTGRVILRPPGSALITVNDEKRVERQRLTINAQTATLWQAPTKPGQPSLYKELLFVGAADSQSSGGKDRLTFLLSKTALLDP